MKAAAQLVSLVISCGSLPLALTLLSVGVTWQGRSLAISVIFALAALLLASFGRAQSQRRRHRLALGLGAASLALAVAVISKAPSSTAPPSARLHHLYAEGELHHRWALGNIVPEIDQLMLGFAVMPFVDRLLTHHQAAPLRRWTRDIYRELDADPEFRAAGSVMPLAYADLRGGDVSSHAFLYVPRALDRTRPAGALLFLHGSGGNFKAYVWLLSKVADRLNLVVIAPTFGMGNWTSRETGLRVSAAMAAARGVVMLDTQQVHAIGLSNGGLGLSHLLASAQREYRSFVFLSPVVDDPVVREFFVAPNERKPAILVLTGARDDRVPLSYVEDAARQLQRRGAEVAFQSFGDADHFLLFSHREQVLSRLERWLTNLR